jgi:hypothetical protein
MRLLRTDTGTGRPETLIQIASSSSVRKSDASASNSAAVDSAPVGGNRSKDEKKWISLANASIVLPSDARVVAIWQYVADRRPISLLLFRKIATDSSKHCVDLYVSPISYFSTPRRSNDADCPASRPPPRRLQTHVSAILQHPRFFLRLAMTGQLGRSRPHRQAGPRRIP